MLSNSSLFKRTGNSRGLSLHSRFSPHVGVLLGDTDGVTDGVVDGQPHVSLHVSVTPRIVHEILSMFTQRNLGLPLISSPLLSVVLNGELESLSSAHVLHVTGQ